MSESSSHQTINAITKILHSIISKEYPQITGYSVTSDCFDDVCEYDIVVFIDYVETLLFDLQVLRKKIKHVVKYVISPPDGVNRVIFSQPKVS